MVEKLLFEGVIKNVSYDPRTRSGKLNTYDFADFDINNAKKTGILRFDDETLIGYAQWTSPKRTRTYPLPRTYNIYHLPKKVVIIPIIKDEGQRTNNDRITYMTYSWMNLSNVYIILGWYETASRHKSRDGRITNQKLNATFINERLKELRTYQQTALHWNTEHFRRHFEYAYHQAVHRYEKIAHKTGAKLVSRDVHLEQLEKYSENGNFSLDKFRDVSLASSYQAAQRELNTNHLFEHLIEVNKPYFFIKNYLGGIYHLTCDETVFEEDRVIIQESKNTTKHALPKRADIQDGLFKLILYSNLDELKLNGKLLDFGVRLKLTGNLNGKLMLPTDNKTLEAYIRRNTLKSSDKNMIQQLNEETIANPGLEIELNSNAQKS